MTRQQLTAVLYRTVELNGMRSGVHVRLMVTRGIKRTPGRDPRLVVGGPTVVIIAEHKLADPETARRGIRLFTSAVRRGSPDYLDARLNCHSKPHELVASMESKGETVVREILLGPHDKPVVFFKNMTRHLVEISWNFLSSLKNVLLTRDPREMPPSYAAQVNRPTLADTGYRAQVRLLEYPRERGQEPPALEAREVLMNPRGVLTGLCRRLEIPFDEAMLRWQPGPRPEDGVWARHWYAGVHRSSGFQPYLPKVEPFPEELSQLLAECLPYYERLDGLALRG